MTNAQLRKWPNGALAAQASNRKGELKPKVEKQLKKREEEQKSCAQAKKEPTVVGWRSYLSTYPEGACVRLAKESLLEMDRAMCKKNAQESRSYLWKEYLDLFPQGTCAQEAKDKSRLREFSDEERSNLDGLIKECMRFANDCPKLADRFSLLKSRNEVTYLRNQYYTYLSNWLSGGETAQSAAMTYLDTLAKEGVAVEQGFIEVDQKCVVPCTQNQETLKELVLCREAVMARGAQSSDLWLEYRSNYPAGVCISIAQ